MRCSVLGHRYRVRTDGRTTAWSCARGCGAGGSKTCPDAASARRYAVAFDREDGGVGDRPGPIGLLPLRIAAARRRRDAPR